MIYDISACKMEGQFHNLQTKSPVHHYPGDSMGLNGGILWGKYRSTASGNFENQHVQWDQ